MRLSFESMDATGRALLEGLASRAEAQGAHSSAAALRGVELGDDYLSDAGAQIVLAAWSCARDAHAVLGALPWGDVVCADEERAVHVLASREQAVQLMVLAETLLGDGEEGDDDGGVARIISSADDDGPAREGGWGAGRHDPDRQPRARRTCPGSSRGHV